tara:strand:+ start:1751 stop:1897 length:147 start_codon:yes stop_codon:yes gene_type:complete
MEDIKEQIEKELKKAETGLPVLNEEMRSFSRGKHTDFVKWLEENKDAE